MKILSEIKTEQGVEWVLVKYEDNFYAYGFKSDLSSLLGFPVDQCGTKAKVLNHCLSIIKLCKKHITEYNKRLKDDKEELKGWQMLICHEQEEVRVLNTFAKLLKA